MTLFDTERAAASRTPNDIVVVGVRQCCNHYATIYKQGALYPKQLEDVVSYQRSGGGLTVTANTTEAPDKTTTADTVNFAAATDYLRSLSNLQGFVAASDAFTFSIWLRTSSGTGTITIRLQDDTNSQGTESTVNLTTTWTRFSVHRLFTAGATGRPVAVLIRNVGDLASVIAWGFNLTENPANVNAVFLWPTLANDAVADNEQASSCGATDAGDGARCFYSYPTCQDLAGFNPGHAYEATTALQGLKEYKFCRQDAPLPLGGENIVPALTSYSVAAQKIDPQRAVTVNERENFGFQDFTPPGLWNADKAGESALVNTAAPGAGTFFRRFLVIHKPYSNPEGYVIRKEGFVASGFTEALYAQRFKGIARNITMTSTGRVEMECIDRLRMTRVKGPAAISDENLLNGAINNSVTSLVVDDATEFSTPGAGYFVTILIDTEKMNVTAIDVLTNTLTVQRGRWGTSAASHLDNATITEVMEFGTERTSPNLTPNGKNPIDIAIELLMRSGIAEEDIDTATLYFERDTWMPSTIDSTTGTETGTTFRRTVTEPTEMEKLLTEIREAAMLFLWIGEDQRVTGKLFAPARANETLAELTDNENFIAGSLSVDDNDESRINSVIVAYDLAAGEDGDKVGDFQKVRYRIDAQAQSREGYGDERLKTILSQWLRPGDRTTADRLTSRLLRRYRNGVRLLSFALELKDESVKLGDTVSVSTALLQTAFGATHSGRLMQIVSKRRTGLSRLDYQAMDTGLFARYGFIAPAGHPDYNSATDAEKRYGFVGTATNNQVGTTKDAGYLIW